MPTVDEAIADLQRQIEELKTAKQESAGTAKDRLHELLVKFAGSEKLPADLAQLCVPPGGTIPRAASNPVEVPASAIFGNFFDVLDTASGARIGAALGVRSGFFAEFAAWAPVVAGLFDWYIHFLRFCSHPSQGEPLVKALEPFASCLAPIIELAANTLEVHRLHAAHVNTPLSEAYRAVAASVRLEASSGRFLGDTAQSTLKSIRDSQQRAALKHQAEHSQRGGFAGRSSSRGGFSRGGRRGGNPNFQPLGGRGTANDQGSSR